MHSFLMEWAGKVGLHSMRGFSRVGPLGKSVRVRLQDGKLNISLAPPGPVLYPRKYLTLETFEVNLYPGERDPALKTIQEPGSAKRLLKLFDSVQWESLSPKYSSQGIVTLWNMEFLHQAQRAFTSSTTEGPVRGNMYCYRQDPTVNRIVSHIVSHAAKLRDEPLAASLYCMRRLEFDIRGQSCQTLLSELRKRRSHLALPALARLCVVLTRELLYGNLVLAEFAPLLHSYIRRMASDQDVQLVSTAFGGAHEVMTKNAFKNYVLRVKELFLDRRIKLNPATLCSVLRFLTERQGTLGNSKVVTEVAAIILRRAGNLLLPHVLRMEEIDVVRILSVLDNEHEPAPLIEALSQRLSKSVEASKEPASIHVMACMRPSSLEEKVKLEDYLRKTLQDLLPTRRSFPALSKILQKSLYQGYDHKVFAKFWSVFEPQLGSVIGGDGESYFHELSLDYVQQKDQTFTIAGPAVTFLSIVVKYVRICGHMNKEYRHLEFESTASRLVLEILRTYEDGNCVITTRDYAGCVAFLIATGHPNVTIKPSFLQQFRAQHFVLLKFAMLLSDGCSSRDIETALEQQVPAILTARLGATEYLKLARVTADSRGELFQQSMRMIEDLPWNNARLATEYLELIKSLAYYSDRSFRRISQFIREADNGISWSCAAEFVTASYICGVDHLDAVLRITASAIEKNPCKADPLVTVRTMLALCYHRYLSKDLANQIFSEKYLGRVDKHIKAKPLGSRQAADLRHKLMELNRAVCINMPEAGVQWFHGKYCQHMATKAGPRPWSSEHFQVHKALLNIVGSPCLRKDAYSPYFHEIDFVTRIDGKGNPVAVMCKEEAAGQLAIIVHHLDSYTNGEERRLKGFHKLRRRHLEALGYRVIEVDPLDWRKLRSSKNRAEVDYLGECIFQ